MENQSETITDIIAEKRRVAKKLRDIAYRNGVFSNRDKSKIEDLEYEADRLEAALKREMAAYEQTMTKNPHFAGVSKMGGDCAKLREALEKINSLCGIGVVEISSFEIGSICDAALAAPPRNCDVGTPTEQAERWYWRYHIGHLCQSCPLGPRKWSEIDAGTLCFSEWLQMPYKEGGAK